MEDTFKLMEMMLNAWALAQLHTKEFEKSLLAYNGSSNQCKEILLTLHKLIQHDNEAVIDRTQNVLADYLSSDYWCILLFELTLSILAYRELRRIKSKSVASKQQYAYAKACRNIRELCNKAKKSEWTWLPEFLLGIIHQDKDKEFFILRCNEAINLAEETGFMGIPLSLVYNSLALAYYDEGHFYEAKTFFEKAYLKWKESPHISNNRAFLLAIMKDNSAESALRDAYERFQEDSHTSFNYGAYILRHCSDSKPSLKDALILMQKASEKFLEEYQNTKYDDYILDAFASGVLYQIANQKIGRPSHTKVEPSSETEVARLLLSELLIDVDNFLTAKLENERAFYNFFNKEKSINIDDNHFCMLRRWNSYTPLIPPLNINRTGGGFFLSWQGKGIVFDPGPGFCTNFYRQGYSLSDIDLIIISHGHIDHTEELERILTLLFEQKQMLDEIEFKRVSIVASPGVFAKYSALLTRANEVLQDCIIAYPKREISISQFKLRIKTESANHFELFSKQDNCLSIIVELMNDEEVMHRLAITNDTSYVGRDSCIKEFFADYEYDIIVANVGSLNFARLLQLSGISLREDWLSMFTQKNEIMNVLDSREILESFGYEDLDQFLNCCFKKVRNPELDWYKKHLGFRGVLNLLKSCKYDYCILTEFGEELRAHRHILARTFNEVLHVDRVKILSGDIGTKLKLTDNGTQFYCDVCNQYSSMKIKEGVVKNEDYRVIHYCSDGDELHNEENIRKLFGVLL